MPVVELADKAVSPVVAPTVSEKVVVLGVFTVNVAAPFTVLEKVMLPAVVAVSVGELLTVTKSL